MFKPDIFTLPHSGLRRCGLLLWLGMATWLNAHYCGNPTMLLTVGDIGVYTIKADVVENQPTQYEMVINANPGLAEVISAHQFSSYNTGDFTVKGLAPGTNTILFHWAYPPNNAANNCALTVIVTAASGASPGTTTTSGNQPASSFGGDPVNLFTGEFVLEEPPDLYLAGPLPVTFRRFYAARLGRNGVVRSSLGDNWMHNYDYRLLTDTNGAQAFIIFEHGRRLEFTNAVGGWTLVRPLDVPFQLRQSGTNYYLGDPGTGYAYQFDNLGRLLRIEDGKGNAHSLSYDGLNVKQVSDGLGNTLTFSYIGLQQLFSVTDGTRVVGFAQTNPEFVGYAWLVGVTNVLGKTTAYGYDATRPMEALMTSLRVPAGNTILQQSYDSLGRVISQRDAYNNTYGFGYNGLTTTVTNPLAQARSFTFNHAGQATVFTDEAGQQVFFTYDSAGRRNSVRDRRNGLTTAVYHSPSGKMATLTHPNDAQFNVTYRSRTNSQGLVFYDVSQLLCPDGTTEKFDFNTNGHLIAYTNRAGHVWRFVNNARGQTVASTNAMGGISIFNYFTNGLLSSIRDPATNLTSFAYDNLRRRTTVTWADGTSRYFSYNAANWIMGVTNELGRASAFGYDANGSLTNSLGFGGTNPVVYAYDLMNRVVRLTDQAGRNSYFSYDALGRTRTVTNRNGQVVTFNHDARGRLASVSDPAGQQWGRGYDGEAGPVSLTNAVNNRLELVLDKLGRPTRFIEPNQAVTQFAYDRMGQLTNLVDGAGAVAVSAGYDSRGLLTSVTLPGGIRAQYSRDESGMLSSIVDPNGRLWQLGSDLAGRLVSATDPLGNTEGYDYDNRGRPAHVVSALGTITLTYDTTGNLTRRQSTDGLDLRYDFDVRGLLTNATGITFAHDVTGEITNCNGLGIAREAEGWVSQITYAPGKTVAYQYDNRDRLAQVTDWLGGVTTFAYDQARRMTNVTRPNGVSTTITYDANNEIASITETAASQLSAIVLTRNNLGRITAAARNLPQSAAPALSSSTFTYNQASRLNGAVYDALGRLVSDATRTNAWDLASRLTSYTEGSSTVTFGYDAGGLMTSRTQDGGTRNYVWNYASALPSLAVVRTNGADLRYYIYTPAGALLYSIEAGSNGRRFYHFDEAGNTLFLTSDAGAVTDTYVYTPFGRLVARNGSADNPFTFNGRWGVMQEGATGLYYMRARFYDAKVARFLSPDPIRALDPLAVNPYQFALNNPLRYADATGLLPGDGGNSGMNPVGQAVANVIDPDGFQFGAGIFGLLNNANDALSAANTLRLMQMGKQVQLVRAAGLRNAAVNMSRALVAAKEGRVSQALEGSGKGFAIGAGVLGALDEAMKSPLSSTPGVVVDSLGVGVQQGLLNLDPRVSMIASASSIVDNCTDLVATYAEVDIKAPKLVEVYNNTSRTAGAIVDYACTGDSRGAQRLVDRWKSGELGSASRFLATRGEMIGDFAYDLCAGESGQFKSILIGLGIMNP